MSKRTKEFKIDTKDIDKKFWKEVEKEKRIYKNKKKGA